MAALAKANYHVGDLLGRGASGSVFRALNILTGEAVAIKSISLLSLSPSVLPDIMSEIDLLKNLNHPNIVKYKGFVRDKESLHIILEYCENGSLQSILKKFGKFPESLVAVYMAQVLKGLIYLHEQGVVHRDIKGANILTNKDGSVKLADFGVSSRTAGTKEGEDGEVVGSPYWMAPEVIEQSGASTASDIWSVGCVVLELLEGQPPYNELSPMQALWRIVQDESMKVPEGASPIVKDFLYHCFQKDPNLRVSAKKLLRHPWMLSARQASDPSTPPDAPPPRRIASSSLTTGQERSIRQPSNSYSVEGAAQHSSGQPNKPPTTVYDEAVMRVREWNEALNASPTKMSTLRRVPHASHVPRKPSGSASAHTKKPSDHNPLAGLFSKPSAVPALPTRTSADSLSAEPSTSANPSPHNAGIQKNLHMTDVLSRAKEEDEAGESWDDDFASDISLANVHQANGTNADPQEDNQHTLRPGRSPTPARATPARSRNSTTKPDGSRTVSTSVVEDYSDLAIGEDDGLAAKLANLKLRNKTQRGILHPNDLRKLKQEPPPSTPRITSTPAPIQSTSSTLPSPVTPRLPSPSALGVTSPRPAFRSPPSSRQNSFRSRAETADSQPELDKYTEKDDEDYSDIFDKQSTLGSAVSHSLKLTRRSNKSWLGDEDGDEADPFAEIEDDFSADDLEANVLRDKKATMCAAMNKLIDNLVPKSSSFALRETCDELLALLDNAHEDLGLEEHFISSHGMLAVLEVLEEKLTREAAVRLLKIVNIIVMSNVDALESFCLVGGIPVIIPYTSKKHSLETRLEAATFVQQLTRSALTLHMFISCRGLKVLVELLDEDYSVNKTLILSSLEGIGSVFELQSPTPRNDFCRMFVRENILDPLSTSILSIMKDQSLSTDDDSCARAVNILLLFSQVAQADSRVRDAFANRSIMIRQFCTMSRPNGQLEELTALGLLEACSGLPRKLMVVAIKAIKHLATSPQLIETLQNSMAMNVLVELLGKSINRSHGNEIGSHIFQTIYSMTRLSKSRQEEAASSGIIPLLKTVIEGKSPLKPFALPVLCDMANAGKVSRRQLWRVDGLKLYLNLLSDPYWRVSALDAILAWMQDETARVEDVLLEKDASRAIMTCFIESTGVSFEGILDPLLKISRLSISVTAAITQPPLFKHLASALSRPLKAVTKLNLLRLTRVFFESQADLSAISMFGVREVVDRLSRQDDAVLVRELAKEILPTLGPKPAPPKLSSETHRHRETIRSSISRPAAMPSSSSSRSINMGNMGPPALPDRSTINTARRVPIPESPRSTTSTGHRLSPSPRSAYTSTLSSESYEPLSARSPDPSEPRRHKRRISRQLR